jgi:hypothetical protein
MVSAGYLNIGVLENSLLTMSRNSDNCYSTGEAIDDNQLIMPKVLSCSPTAEEINNSLLTMLRCFKIAREQAVLLC